VEPSQRQILWTASLSHGLIHVCELAVPALLLLIQQEFGSGDFTMGRVVTAYGLLFGLGSLPAGALVDRVGSKLLLLACLWGAALCLAGMALSPSLGSFAVTAGAMGLCLSIYHPAGTALITHALPMSGRVFALHGMIGNLGVAGSGLIAGTLGALLGWRWALGVLALVVGALGFVVLGLPRVEARSLRERRGTGGWAAFSLLLVAAAFMGMVYRGVTTFLPKFFAIRLELDPTAGTAIGGLLTSLALLVGLVGMFMAGRLADRGVALERVFLLGAVAQVPFLLALSRVGGPLLLAPAMAVAFFHFLTQPPANHMIAELTPPHLRGLGYGIYFFVAFGAGSWGSTLGGWASDRFGLAETFPVLAGVLVPSILAVLALIVVRRRAVASAVAAPSA
jgi:MFS family permease